MNLLWNDDELRLAVQAYLYMLQYEKEKTPYAKTEIIRNLQKNLIRSKGSIERRFQNISYVFTAHKLPFLKGYVPLSNVGPTNEEKIWQLIQKLK